MCSAMMTSVASGRWGPWASSAPTASSATVCGRSMSRTSSHVRPASSRIAIAEVEYTMAFTPPERFNIAEYFLDARVAAGQGDRPALMGDDGPLSYASIQSLANRFGTLLARAGVEPEHRVLLALPDGPAFVAALFGTLKLGAVVVMVNPGLPPGDIAYFLEYTRARVVVTHRDCVAGFKAAAAGSRFT